MNEYRTVVQAHAGPSLSPGIVPIPYVFEEGCRTTMVYPKFTIDFFEFIDIYARHHRRMGCSERIARVWLAQMLQSLSVCTEQNIVHRDLKLENLLMDERGNCVIADFELALWNKKATEGGFTDNVDVVGTPMYIPPEVIVDRRVHVAKNDMWSVGVVAWEMVSNSNPWRVDPDSISLHRLLETTKKTTKGSFKKEEHMSDEMFEFVTCCVCPVEERLTPTEAMKLDFFKGISFDSNDLFPRDEALDDLEEVKEMLVVYGNRMGGKWGR